MNREMLLERLGVNAASLAAVCRKWLISEMALFGSVLVATLRPLLPAPVRADSGPDPAAAPPGEVET